MDYSHHPRPEWINLYGDDDVERQKSELNPELSRWEWVAVTALALTMLAILASVAGRTGVTADEPGHLLSADLLWQGRDAPLSADLPPLIKITGGWMPVLLGLPLPKPDSPAWQRGRERELALELMRDLNAVQIQRLFFWSRAPLFVFPIGCALLLWWWGRQLYSPAVGFLVALAFALSPTVLGHGALFNNDLAGAFGYLLFWYRAWVYWKNPGMREASWLGAALLLAITAKFSMLMLAPLAFALFTLRHVTAERFSWRSLAAAVTLTALIVISGINLAWPRHSPPLTASEVNVWRLDPGIPALVSSAAQLALHIPMPGHFWRGVISLVDSKVSIGPAYFLGDLWPEGHWLYFVTALVVKMRVSALTLVILGLGLCAVDFARRRAFWRDLFWLAPPFLYLALASFLSLQLGVRLVMPALPFLFLILGRILRWRGVWELGPAIPVILVCWLATAPVAGFPHYISYFNRWAGGPDQGLQYLSDSNVDWGQDLPELARIVKQHEIQHLRLAYSGADNPAAHLSDRVIETIAPPSSDELARGESRLRPQPGYYAISATLLTGQLFAEEYRDYFAEFRELRPIAKAGYSIHLYRVRGRDSRGGRSPIVETSAIQPAPQSRPSPSN